MSEYNFNAGSITAGPFTYIPTGKYPIVGAAVYPTYNDMIEFVHSSKSTAYGGSILYVVADTDMSKNGAYEVRFVNPSLKDENGSILYFDSNKQSNLEAVKLVTVDEQGGIESGNIINGFYATIENRQVFVKRNGTEGAYTYSYVNESGDDVVYNGEIGTINPYIVLNMTNGDKVYIDANEFKSVSDTFVKSGAYNVETKKLTLTRNNNSTVEIDLSGLAIDNSTLTTDGTDTTPYTTLEATTGAFNDAAAKVIKNYIDNYDCGTFIIDL